MSSELATRKCSACRGDVPALKGDALKALHQQLGGGWNVVEDHHLEKEFAFDSYRAGVDFANVVADIAEEEDHHPDILLTYRKVKVTVWTHKAGGLTENDFIFAAKVEERAPKR